MANWKKIGAAWATGGASLAYDKAKQRAASTGHTDAEDPAAPGLPAGMTADQTAGFAPEAEVSGLLAVDPDAGVATPADADTDDDDEPGADGFEFAVKDAAVATQVSKLKKKVKKSLETNLGPGEVIQVVIRGAAGQAIVGTVTRAFVLKPGFLAGASFGAEVTTWSYRTLAGVQVHKGMVSGAVVIQAPGQSGVSTSYWGDSKDDPYKAPNAIPVAGDWGTVQQGAAQLRALIDAAHAPAPQVAPSAPAASMASELAQLAELRAAGHLSDEEFSAAKQRLLGG